MNLSALGSKAAHYLSKNSPAILMGFSLAGVITTAYLTHKAAQKATKELSTVTGLTPKETFQLTWKYYIPPALSCGATLAFIIAGNSVHHRRQAALVTAVTLSETAFSEYKEKTIEAIGKGKELKIRDEIVQDKVNKAEEDGKFDKLIIRPDTQDQYVYDEFSDRTLVSTVEKLNRAANETERIRLHDGRVSLNVFYDKIGLRDIPIGDQVGWNDAVSVELDLGSAVVRDGMGLIAIRFVTDPTINFDSNH